MDLNKLSVQSIRQEIVIMNNFSGANYFIIFTHCSKSSFFVQKFNFDFPEKIVDFFGQKTRENVVVLDFFAVDNFDFTRKNCQN